MRNILGSLIGAPLSRTKVKTIYIHQDAVTIIRTNQMKRLDGLGTAAAENSVTERSLNMDTVVPSDQLVSADEKGRYLNQLQSLVKSINTHTDSVHLTTFSTLKKVSQLHV